MPACSRYAKTTAAYGTAVGSGAGGEAPGRTSHYSREAVLGLCYHVPHPKTASTKDGMNPAFLVL
jgi:hypothetical protein